MPIRLIIAYVLIAAVLVGSWIVYLHVTKERRSYKRSARSYRLAKKRSAIDAD